MTYDQCQEINFGNKTFLCGEGTKIESRRAVIGNGNLFDVETSNCSDCGDLTAALTWGEWLVCEDTKTSNESLVEGKMMCRRRGNPQIGIEEEQKGDANSMMLKSELNFPQFSECPSPWISLSTGCYRFLEKGMTWYEAKTACNNITGHLVKVETEEEQALLVAEIKKRRSPYMWIDLNDLDEEGVWRWSESIKATFSSWGYVQPNSSGGEQDCAVIDMSFYNGEWNDFWCSKGSYSSKAISAICEL